MDAGLVLWAGMLAVVGIALAHCMLGDSPHHDDE
jgi:hypothetical protein